MAKIKIKDLTKGMKITEEELEKVRGGLDFPRFPPRRRTPPPPIYNQFELCQYIQSMACGCPG